MCQPGIQFILQCCCEFSSPVPLFKTVEVARRDTDLFGGLELGESELLSPALELVAKGGQLRQVGLMKEGHAEARLVVAKLSLCDRKLLLDTGGGIRFQTPTHSFNLVYGRSLREGKNVLFAYVERRLW